MLQREAKGVDLAVRRLRQVLAPRTVPKTRAIIALTHRFLARLATCCASRVKVFGWPWREKQSGEGFRDPGFGVLVGPSAVLD